MITTAAPLTGETEVTLDPTHPGFRRLVAELADKQGIYWLEHRGLVLKVGQSGKRGGPGSGIGHRLTHHVAVAYRDVPSHRKCRHSVTLARSSATPPCPSLTAFPIASG